MDISGVTGRGYDLDAFIQTDQSDFARRNDLRLKSSASLTSKDLIRENRGQGLWGRSVNRNASRYIRKTGSGGTVVRLIGKSPMEDKSLQRDVIKPKH